MVTSTLNTEMFTAAFFTLAPKWKQSKCPSIYERINKKLYIHTMGYYPAIKRNEVVIPATTWVNRQNITASERSQTRKATYILYDSVYT